MKNILTQILKITLLLSLGALPAWSLTKDDVGDLEDQVTKMTMKALLNEQIFPNISTPDLDMSVEYSFASDGSFLRKAFADLEIPQNKAITYEVYQHQEVNESEVTLLIGGPRFFIVGSVELQGAKGFLGENGYINVSVVKNPLKPENTTVYPVIVKNSKIGNVYFKIQEVSGNFSFDYDEVLCATQMYRSPVCDPAVVGKKKAGDTIMLKVEGADKPEEFEVTVNQSLASVTFDLNAFIEVKMGDLKHRKFKEKTVNLKGTYRLDGKYQADLIYNTDKLPRD